MGLLAMDCLRVIDGLGGLSGLRVVGGLESPGVEPGDSLLGAGVEFPCGSASSSSS